VLDGCAFEFEILIVAFDDSTFAIGRLEVVKEQRYKVNIDVCELSL